MVQCDDPATASPPERGSVIIRCFGISFSASPKCEVGGLLAVTLETRALQRCGHTVPRSLHPPNKQHPLRRTLSPASRASHPRHDGIGRRVTVADLPVLRPVVCRDRGGVTAGAFARLSSTRRRNAESKTTISECHPNCRGGLSAPQRGRSSRPIRRLQSRAVSRLR